MNQTAMVMMAGHVVAEPRLGQTRSGQRFARVRIGVTPRRLDRDGEWRDIASSYFTVNCWRRMATNASASGVRIWANSGVMRAETEMPSERRWVVCVGIGDEFYALQCGVAT